VKYRDCRITRNWVTKSGPPAPDEYEWVHVEYDGPDGGYPAGHAGSLEDAKSDIDEWHEEKERE
jgi:hypothetical protein